MILRAESYDSGRDPHMILNLRLRRLPLKRVLPMGLPFRRASSLRGVPPEGHLHAGCPRKASFGFPFFLSLGELPMEGPRRLASSLLKGILWNASFG